LVLDDPESGKTAYWYDQVRSAFILGSVCATIILGVSPQPILRDFSQLLESSIEALFFIEVLLRFALCPKRSHFLRSPHNIIDCLSSLPLLLRGSTGFSACEDYEPTGLVCFILISMVPVIRLVKMLRHFRQFHLLLKAFMEAFEALPVLVFTMAIIVLVFSALIFLVEPRTNIETLPQAFWLCLVSMTTVGYGDVVPESSAGFIIVSVLILLSVLYMAMPLGIIGFAFTQIWKDRDRILVMQRTREKITQWGYSANEIRRVFQYFDDDGSGQVEIDEFRQLVTELQIGLSDDRVTDLFNFFDTDKDGCIDEKEFVLALFPDEYAKIYGDENKRRVSQMGINRLDTWESGQERPATARRT